LAANVAEKCHGSSQENLDPGTVFALTVGLPINQSIPRTVTYLKENEKLRINTGSILQSVNLFNI
jgi:hypothetical protein